MEPSPTPAAPSDLEPPASARPPGRPDVDFLPDPFPAPTLPAGFDPAGHQRLVVNPFLAVAGIVGWLRFVTPLVLNSPPLGLLALWLLAFLPFLIHFHCIDCGATGVWHRWRRHACARIITRTERHRPVWVRWPRPTTQLVVWLYLLGAVGILALMAVLSANHRRV